ncbi:unnamed protein product [Coregonus sp. 'balchen']|nr:unnamed protein product [Coregonus sp. 'balchen']
MSSRAWSKHNSPTSTLVTQLSSTDSWTQLMRTTTESSPSWSSGS